VNSAPSRVVREARRPGAVPLYHHPDWPDRFPWLVQGTTGRGGAEDHRDWFDLGLFGATPVGTAMDRWRLLLRATGCARAVHARQVHRADLLWHDEGPPGLSISDAFDGHATATPGVLLAVSVADCVPVFLVDPEFRAVAAVHAGWRGAAAGVLEAGIRTLVEHTGARAERLHLHLGPAICGQCYEVGPEVHAALGQRVPDGPTPIDVRAILAARAAAAGIPHEHTTVSAFCTRCGDSPFFSHRGGCAERQMGVIAVLD
jgi:polyphenol oxidase